MEKLFFSVVIELVTATATHNYVWFLVHSGNIAFWLDDGLFGCLVAYQESFFLHV